MGKGCKRANCQNHFMGTVYGANRNRTGGECTNEHSDDVECVKECKGWGEEWGCQSQYCTDCRVKECEKDWKKSCGVCVKTIAPVLVKEIERLRIDDE